MIDREYGFDVLRGCSRRLKIAGGGRLRVDHRVQERIAITVGYEGLFL
jgi:hypothetical protein